MINNHGISLKEMIMLLCILLFCLLLVCFYGESLGSSLLNNDNKDNNDNNYIKSEIKKESKSDSHYKDYELKMKEAAKRYISFYDYKSFSDDVIITLNTMINTGFIEKLYDGGEVCSGYVVIKDTNDDFVINEYLECPNYVTGR